MYLAELFDGTTAHLVKALLLADLFVKLARSRRLAPLPHLGVHMLGVYICAHTWCAQTCHRPHSPTLYKVFTSLKPALNLDRT